MTDARIATAVDIVRRLTGTPYKAHSEATLGWGMGNAQLGIRDAIDEAIDRGWVAVARTQRTTYAGQVRMISLADGVAYCRTCIAGCQCESGGATSCGHHGCWGPNPTLNCPGAAFGRTQIPMADWDRAAGLTD